MHLMGGRFCLRCLSSGAMLDLLECEQVGSATRVVAKSESAELKLSDADRFQLPSYADLVNNKIVVPSSTTPYFAIEQYFFFDCMRASIAAIDFDESWYLSRYVDVREAIGRGLVRNAKEHYCRFGYYEHRLPYQIDVNESWYLETYPDVRVSIERRDFGSAANHFDLAGYKEGRLPYPRFRLRTSGGE
jgi:hypothetical protein